MVHILRKDATGIGEAAGSDLSLTAIAESMQEKLKVAAWREERAAASASILGTGFPAERAAYAAWRSGHVVDSAAYAALQEV